MPSVSAFSMSMVPQMRSSVAPSGSSTSGVRIWAVGRASPARRRCGRGGAGREPRRGSLLPTLWPARRAAPSCAGPPLPSCPPDRQLSDQPVPDLQPHSSCSPSSKQSAPSPLRPARPITPRRPALPHLQRLRAHELRVGGRGVEWVLGHHINHGQQVHHGAHLPGPGAGAQALRVGTLCCCGRGHHPPGREGGPVPEGDVGDAVHWLGIRPSPSQLAPSPGAPLLGGRPLCWGAHAGQPLELQGPRASMQQKPPRRHIARGCREEGRGCRSVLCP